MLKKLGSLLVTTLGDIKTPGVRLNIILLIIAVGILGRQILNMQDTRDRENKDQIKSGRIENDALRRENDSLKTQIFIDSTRANQRLIEYMQRELHHQNKIKKSLIK